MVLKNPSRNRAYLRGERLKSQWSRRPLQAASPASDGYAALVNRLAKSIKPPPRLIVPTEEDHIGFPQLNPVLDDRGKATRRLRKQKKLLLKKQRQRMQQDAESTLTDGLHPVREDNTYLDRAAIVGRWEKRQQHAVGRLVRRAGATDSTYAAANRRGLRPGRPRTVPDPEPAHITIFQRQRKASATNASKQVGQQYHHHRNLSLSSRDGVTASVPQSSSTVAAPLVSAIPQEDRDMYTPMREVERAPLAGVWSVGPNDYVRVSFDELEVGIGGQSVRSRRIHSVARIQMYAHPFPHAYLSAFSHTTTLPSSVVVDLLCKN